MYEYNLNTIKEFSKDNNNLFGFLSGNTILLIKENKIQYFNIEIVEETNWGSTLYKTIIKPVNNMSDKSLNIRIVKD